VFRIGNSTGEVRGWQSATMYKRLTGNHATLVAAVGELGRGYWWREEDIETTVIPPERLVALCRCPLHEEPLARARVWLQSAPTTNALHMIALFLLEQDCGCWAGVWPYAECDSGYDLFPLCHRGIVEAILRLPASYRRSGRLQRDVIAREWPELLAWPFNRPVGLGQRILRAKRTVRRRIGQILRDPRWPK